MSSIVVSAQDTRPFFDKVLDHAVDYDILSEEQRARLAEDCNNIHPDICSTFGFNFFDIGQTLEAATLVKQMLSVQLEALSNGNVADAVQILQKNSLSSMLIGMIQEVRQDLQRLALVAKTSQRFSTKFGYNVTIYKARPQTGKRTRLIPHLDCANILLERGNSAFFESSGCLLNLFKALTSNVIWQQLRQDIADLEQELAVSKKYLPWDLLVEEAKLQAAVNDRDEYIWTAETLLATMCVIFVTGGSNRFIGFGNEKRCYGTVYPKLMLSTLPTNLASPKEFRKRATQGFNSFLRYRSMIGLQEKTDTTNQEMDILESMLNSALDTLLPPHTKLPPKAGLGFWLDHLHVAIEADEFKSLHRKEFPKAGRRLSRAEKIDRALDVGDSPALISNHVAKLNWGEAEKEGMADELIRRLDAQILLPHLPMLVPMINRVLAVWKTPTGSTLWPKEQRQQLVRRALEGGSDLFWSGLDRWALEDLAAVDPDLKNQIEERYTQAFAKTAK